MKILVTGASSLVGFRIILELLRKRYEVVALYNKNPISVKDERLKKRKMDMRDMGGLKKLIRAEAPDVVIHAAALGDVDLCEKEKDLAWKTNVDATVALANSLARGSRMIYVSTDFVFDGERGNYKEADMPNPVNYYGLTKLCGEIACMSSGNSNSVVRTSSLYGFGPGRMNFAKVLVAKLEKNEPVKALVDQYTSPTHAGPFAETVVEILERNLAGVFHIAGDRMSRYEFAMKVGKALGFNSSLIVPIKTEEIKWIARRPRDASLDSGLARSRLRTDFSTRRSLEVLRAEYAQMRGIE